MSSLQHGNVISDIKLPVVKASSSILAAVGANTGVAEDVALKGAVEVATLVGSPDMFWTLISLPWGQIASMVAALYTLALLSEWIWKKPLGWLFVKLRLRKPVRKLTKEEWCKEREGDKDDKE